MCRLDEIHSPNAFIVGFLYTLLAKLTFLFQGKSPCQMPRNGNLHFSSNECLLWLAGTAVCTYSEPPTTLSAQSLKYTVLAYMANLNCNTH